MSKIDELRTINNCAYHKFLNDIEGRETEYPDAIVEAERAGIAAVIRALRDEMQSTIQEYSSPECCGMGTQTYDAPPECCGKPLYKIDEDRVLAVFNEILGEAGEKVADAPDLPTRTVQLTGITKSARPDVQFEPATDPAPAVCEWHLLERKQGIATWSSDHRWHAFFTYEKAPLLCDECGLPIKFTEAKP